jgi:hypothetical protein
LLWSSQIEQALLGGRDPPPAHPKEREIAIEREKDALGLVKDYEALIEKEKDRVQSSLLKSFSNFTISSSMPKSLLTPEYQGSASSFSKNFNSPMKGFGFLPSYTKFIPHLENVIDVQLLPYLKLQRRRTRWNSKHPFLVC